GIRTRSAVTPAKRASISAPTPLVRREATRASRAESIARGSGAVLTAAACDSGVVLTRDAVFACGRRSPSTDRGGLLPLRSDDEALVMALRAGHADAAAAIFDRYA